MRRYHTPAVLTAAAAAALLVTTATAAVPIVAVPAEGGAFSQVTQAQAINNNNVIVGSTSTGSQAAFGNDQTFIYQYGASAPTYLSVGDSTTTSTTGTAASVVNNQTVVVGGYTDYNTNTFNVYTASAGGTVTSQITNAGAYASPTGVNTSGTIVGSAYDANFISHGFIISGTNVYTAGSLPGTTNGSNFLAINNKGLIAGYAPDASYANHVVTAQLSGSTITLTDLTIGDTTGLGSTFDGRTLGINDSGTIVGTSNVAATSGPSTKQGWVHTTGGTFTPLAGLLPATYDAADAINTAGVIAGYSSAAGTFDTHAVIWLSAGSTPIDLNTLLSPADAQNIVLEEATGLNDNGLVIVNGTLNGANTAFVMDISSLTGAAVPEPASLGLLTLGAATLLTRRRKA